MTDRNYLFTIGHSTLSFEEFADLLATNGITAVADVRSHPYSRRLPHFCREELSARLKGTGTQYAFLGEELGARRTESESYEGGKASYERICFLPSFQEGLSRLRKGAERYRIAMMCAEKDPIDCHRAVLICRHLRDEFLIKHILSNGQIEDHLETEKRLIQETGITRTLFEPDLSYLELVKRAYEMRGEELAYVANGADIAD